MKIISQRTFTPFDNRDLSGNPSLSPLTPKSVIPANNVPTIQDVLDGTKSIRDLIPHGGGDWSPGEDVDKAYREEGDDYKRRERDEEILRKMLDSSPKNQEKWKVRMHGGSKSFCSFDLANKYIRENKLPYSYITRVAQVSDPETNRVNVIAESIEKTFKIESIDVERGVIESGAAFCISKNHFLTCAHVLKQYNKNQPGDTSAFFKSDVKIIQDGLRRQTKVVKVDLLRDIAIIYCEIDVEPIEIDLEYNIGEDIIVVGSPHGYENNVSTGTVGSKDRKVYSYNGAPEYFFVDLAVFPGNSGGPVIKVSNGKCIGLITLIVSEQGGYGLNAALPPEHIVDFLK